MEHIADCLIWLRREGGQCSCGGPPIPAESNPADTAWLWLKAYLLFAGLLGLVILLAGCGAHPFGTGGVASSTPLATPPPVSSLDVGKVHLRVVYSFTTPKERVTGLQNTLLPAESAAVFSWDGADSTEPFWMIHTPQPLSLLWVKAGRVVGHTEMPRCSMSCPTYHAPASYDTAVEAVGGAFRHVRKGERVNFA